MQQCDRYFSPIFISLAIFFRQCNELAADENDNIEASIDDCQDAEDYDHDYDENEDEEEGEDSLQTKISKKIHAFFNPLRIALAVLLFCGIVKAMIGRHVISVAKLGLGGVRIGEKVVRKVKGEKKVLTYDAVMNLVDTTKYVRSVTTNLNFPIYTNIAPIVLNCSFYSRCLLLELAGITACATNWKLLFFLATQQ